MLWCSVDEKAPSYTDSKLDKLTGRLVAIVFHIQRLMCEGEWNAHINWSPFNRKRGNTQPVVSFITSSVADTILAQTRACFAGTPRF